MGLFFGTDFDVYWTLDEPCALGRMYGVIHVVLETQEGSYKYKTR